MERIPLGDINGRWHSRTPVRTGHIDPPRFGRFLGPKSPTVESRLREQAFAQRTRDQNPQLRPNMIVIHAREPYRIVEIREISFDLWPAEFADEWKALFDEWARTDTGEPAPAQDTWRGRPVILALMPDGGSGEVHLRAAASRTWDVLPEHYAVCRQCGELPPCRDEERERTFVEEMAKSVRLMSIVPGACMGCGDAISSRQRAVRFPGPNLWRPDLADGSVRFHARQECESWVDRYRKQWEAAGKPGFESAVEQLTMGEG